MASNATIVLADATPENHSFQPDGIEGKVARYSNRSAPMLSGRETLELKRQVNGDRLRTATVTAVIPRVVTETLNGVDVPKVVDFMQIKTIYTIPSGWSQGDIEDARTINVNAQDAAAVVALVEDDEFVW